MKRILEKVKFNFSGTIRMLLENYVTERELRDLASRLEALKQRMGGKIDAGLVARLVREDREAR